MHDDFLQKLITIGKSRIKQIHKSSMIEQQVMISYLPLNGEGLLRAKLSYDNWWVDILEATPSKFPLY